MIIQYGGTRGRISENEENARRTIKIEKYYTVSFREDIVRITDKDSIETDKTFIGFNTDDTMGHIIETKNFDKYIIIGRVIDIYKEDEYIWYEVRILKNDINQSVDFEEEKEHLNSFQHIWGGRF